MKRSRVILSTLAVVTAGGSIATGSIVSAQSLPAAPAEHPSVSVMVLNTPDDQLVVCRFSGLAPEIGVAAVPGDAIDSFARELNAHPEDTVITGSAVGATGFATAGSPAANLETRSKTLATPGTPEQCAEADRLASGDGRTITEVGHGGGHLVDVVDQVTVGSPG